MARKLDETDTEEEVRESFRVFDKINGAIPSLEFRNVFKYIMDNFDLNLDEEEANELLKFVDDDDDGFISFSEFAAAMTKK